MVCIFIPRWSKSCNDFWTKAFQDVNPTPSENMISCYFLSQSEKLGFIAPLKISYTWSLEKGGQQFPCVVADRVLPGTDNEASSISWERFLHLWVSTRSQQSQEQPHKQGRGQGGLEKENRKKNVVFCIKLLIHLPITKKRSKHFNELA